MKNLPLHKFLDTNYGPNGDTILRQRLDAGDDPNEFDETGSESPLHVAARRRRKSAVEILLDHGADIDAKSKHGKTAYAHVIRRGFTEIADLLARRGANTDLNPADQFAVAIVNGDLEAARTILADHPNVARTGNPEEDRLLADIAGRNDSAPVMFLIEAGADLAAPALDDGTPLHQAAWFGQPANARLLIDAGAPLDVFDAIHNSSPIGWAVHGSRYSGGAEQRQDVYIELVRMLLEAGSSLKYPDDAGGNTYMQRLLNDATDHVRKAFPNVQ